ncbi:HD domain-containing protein [Lachnospiraceae bacterium]|nr:HD domain-containing protein [Lachnospiraceae bacterium]
MIFVKQDKLKTGMRLAKPIYDRKGVLLYDRNSKLTHQGIESVHNFGIIGLYILEPAEPVPPISEEDIEFERFQMMSTFIIKDEWDAIRKGQQPTSIASLVSQIIKNYGRLDHKINFVQSLRSMEDTWYKHALNVAILSALIANQMQLKAAETNDLVTAALVHDVGKLDIPPELQGDAAKEESGQDKIAKYEASGIKLLDAVYSSSPNIKRICQQSYRALNDIRKGKLDPATKIVNAAKVLMVADTFDMMTAMNDYREPSSEISAIRHLIDSPHQYDATATDGLVKSINILVPGAAIELTDGEKGLVIAENEEDILKPVVLKFSDNSVVDLSLGKKVGKLGIKDVMKTMDNRCIIDHETLEEAGFFRKG